MAKRRKSGEGLIRQRKDGRWEGRVVVGYDDNNLPITKNVTAKTKHECVKKLEVLKESLGKSTEKISADMPFGEWMDFWYQNYSKPGLRMSTQEGYENHIYKHIIPALEKIPLNKLTKADLELFYAKLKKAGGSAERRFTAKACPTVPCAPATDAVIQRLPRRWRRN